MTSLIGLTEAEALEICRCAEVRPQLVRTRPPRPFDGDLWRVVQQREGPQGLLLVLAAFTSEPKESR